MPRPSSPSARSPIAGLLLAAALPSGALAEPVPAATAVLDRAIAAAEASLREGEPQTAESHYRSALFEGWLLVGALERLDGRLPEARDAFRRASTSVVENTRALQGLALAYLQMGEAARAEPILAQLARKNPGDLELAFALASGYLGLKKPDRAAPLFAQIVQARPTAQTHVLLGRTYRDFGEYERAGAELRMALKQDPRARRAHYYLGNVMVAEKGMAGLEEAIREFQAELNLAPLDPLANLELGMALVDLQRPEEALPPLEIAARSEPPQARTFFYLGRAQLGLGRPAEAVASLKRALELVPPQGAAADQLRVIHNQLGQALRALGETQEAATHFAESERLSARGSDAAREQMAQYLADVPGPEAARTPVVPMIEASPLSALSPPERIELEHRVKAALALAYLNLGVMQVQGKRFSRAAELFEEAAAIDPDLPQVQSSLGVAYFNAQRYDKATGPLARAVAARPQDAGLRRMLAMAWLNTQTYDKAAELLKEDPELDTNPSLQFAYGLALVKSDRSAEAEPIFTRLLARHGDSAELSVLLGQAHAQQGDFDSAVESLQRAIRLQPDVAEAHAALGVIYLRQGRLAEAEEALRAELKSHPADLSSQQNLAIVLESEQRPDEALPLLRGVLKAKPESANARYLLGKILLAQGAASEAVEHLEAAVRLAPEDANIRYQLGQAYQRLGRTELAQQQFEVFRRLKDKSR